MKNYQKGFIVPLLIAIIAILVVGGGAYVYLNNKSQVVPIEQNNNSSSTNILKNTISMSDWKQYVQKDGFYSFKYPSRWNYMEGQTALIFTKFITDISGMYGTSSFVIEPKLADQYSKTELATKGFKLENSWKLVSGEGIELYSINTNQKCNTAECSQYQYSHLYIIRLTPTNNGVNLILALYPDTSTSMPLDSWKKVQGNIENMINSMMFDQSKFDILVNRLKYFTEDINVENALFRMSHDATAYFYTNSSYLGICSQKNILTDIKFIGGYVGETNVSCKDSVKSYAITTLIKSGGYACIDPSKDTSSYSEGISSSYYTEVKSLNTADICNK